MYSLLLRRIQTSVLEKKEDLTFDVNKCLITLLEISIQNVFRF